MARPRGVARDMSHLLIVSLSRSGGKLLRTLLDGHPELNVFPFEHWNRMSKNKIPARRIEAFDRLSVEAKLATAGAAHVERKLMRLHPPALVAEVMQAWRVESAGARTLPAAYESLALAYFTALGRARDAVAVNHCGSLCRFTRDQLDAVFGSGRHLLTIRDPRAVFSSMQGLLYRKFTLKRVLKGKIRAGVLERHIQKLETVNSASGYLREFCEDYRTMVARYAACPDVIRIRFEDLVRSPEATMRGLATRLAIRWDSTLLAPTELGIAHSPNSSFARRGSGIHARAADDWAGRMAPSVCRYIEEALAEEMAALGYQRIDLRGRPVLDVAPLLRNC
ncbi:MAG: sulfotransferase [Bryobacteraceae bacterium]